MGLGNNGPTPKEGQAAKKYDDLKKVSRLYAER
jgi:hypothetical protein